METAMNRQIEDILSRTVTMILAGGRGERLHPLTQRRAKPVVPFGGGFRMIDFSLSNCLNSRLPRTYVITQDKYESLDRHLSEDWNAGATSVARLTPRIGASYIGTADALLQNLHVVDCESTDYVLVLAGDHIYSMDYREILRFHVETGAD